MTETQRTEGGELKPCPFCGGPARVFKKYLGTARLNWRMACDNFDSKRGELCDMAIYSDFETQAEAIAAWNRRSTDRREGEDSSGVADAIEEVAKAICHDDCRYDRDLEEASWNSNRDVYKSFARAAIATIDRLRQIQSPSTRREEVIEECAKVADKAAEVARTLAEYYRHANNGAREQAQACALAHLNTAANIRALKSPSPSRKQG